MKVRVSAVSAVLMVLALMASPAFAATVTVNTNSSWNGTDFISSFGIPNTATYGQIIVPPIGMTRLDSFSFQINSMGVAIVFRAEVYAWNPATSRATGPALWESAPVTATADSAYHQYTFTPPGGVTVQPGVTYVLFASTSKDQAGQPNSAARWGSVANTAYPDGQFVFINNTADTTQWTGSQWSTIASDLAFTAAFTGSASGSQDVPALSGLMLVALAGALAIAGALALRFRS